MLTTGRASGRGSVSRQWWAAGRAHSPQSQLSPRHRRGAHVGQRDHGDDAADGGDRVVRIPAGEPEQRFLGGQEVNAHRGVDRHWPAVGRRPAPVLDRLAAARDGPRPRLAHAEQLHVSSSDRHRRAPSPVYRSRVWLVNICTLLGPDGIASPRRNKRRIPSMSLAQPPVAPSCHLMARVTRRRTGRTSIRGLQFRVRRTGLQARCVPTRRAGPSAGPRTGRPSALRRR